MQYNPFLQAEERIWKCHLQVVLVEGNTLTQSGGGALKSRGSRTMRRAMTFREDRAVPVRNGPCLRPPPPRGCLLILHVISQTQEACTNGKDISLETKAVCRQGFPDTNKLYGKEVRVIRTVGGGLGSTPRLILPPWLNAASVTFWGRQASRSDRFEGLRKLSSWRTPLPSALRQSPCVLRQRHLGA